MKEEKGIIYTEPKIEVKLPVRYCYQCLYQQYSAAKEPCNSCMKDTRGSKWEPAK